MAVFFWLSGLAVLAAAPAKWHQEEQYFKKIEPYYGIPLNRKTPFLVIRNDAFGKGYFGAHRNGHRTHKGIDLLAPVGEAVLASKSGRVAVSGWDRGYGLYVEIRHPDGLSSRYAHLRKLYVRSGDWLDKGEPIGAVGKTGNASNPRMSPHLHFEIISKEGSVNPASGLLSPLIALRQQ